MLEVTRLFDRGGGAVTLRAVLYLAYMKHEFMSISGNERFSDINAGLVSDLMNLSRQHANRILRDLEAYGYLDRYSRPYRGNAVSNHYYINGSGDEIVEQYKGLFSLAYDRMRQ